MLVDGCPDENTLAALATAGCLSDTLRDSLEQHLDLCEECRVCVVGLAGAAAVDLAPGDRELGAGDLVEGRFAIEAWAGAGGAGCVYRARDTLSGGMVALKVLRAETSILRDRFEREIALLSEISHPNVVRHIAHGRSAGGRIFLAMEWLPGPTLSEFLRGRRAAVSTVIAIAERLAGALEALHQRGVIHRDLKPGNVILVDGNPERPKLLDLGVARRRSDTSALTSAGAAVGTPGYMAPEQARGELDIDARADLFALGCLIYRGLTGRDPFIGRDAFSTLAKVLLEDAVPIGDLRADAPVGLVSLVEEMMSKARDGRPSDAGEVARRLAALAPSAADAAPSVGAPLPSRPYQALTARELRLLPVLAVLSPRRGAEDAQPAPVLDAAERDGANLVLVGEGACLLLPPATGTAADQARWQASIAAEVVEQDPRCRVAIVTGRALVERGRPFGDVLDRASGLVSAATPGAVVLDELTAQLIEDRYAVLVTPDALLLGGERDAAERAGTGRGVLVGRRRELAHLLTLAEEASIMAGSRTVLLVGPPGIGKSRLVHEVVSRLRVDAGFVLHVTRGDPLASGRPLRAIGLALRTAAGLPARGATPAQRSAFADYVRARHGRQSGDARLAALMHLAELGALGEVYQGDAVADVLLGAWLQWLETEARQPVAFVLEDLQWVDSATLRFLSTAFHAIIDRPVFFLLTGRPEVFRTAGEAFAHRLPQVVALEGLPRVAAEQLLRVHAREIEPAVCNRLVERAAGNPFFLQELARTADKANASLPDSVLALLQARLDALGERARLILRCASAFAGAFTAEAVEPAIGRGEREEIDSAWSELVAEGIVEMDAGEKTFRFTHDLVREAAYSSLTPSDRAAAHSRAAEWMLARDDRAANAAAIADQLERAERPERAIEWRCLAAAQCLRVEDMAAVDAHVERGIADGATGDLLGALFLLRAHARGWRGHAAGIDWVERALALLPRGEERWLEALGVRALLCEGTGDRTKLSQTLDALRETSPLATKHRRAVALAAMRVAYVASSLGDEALADAALEQVDDNAEGLKRDLEEVARWLRAMRHARERPADHAAAQVEALAHYRSTGAVRFACLSMVHGGQARLELGDLEEADRLLRLAQREAARHGFEHVVATAQHHHGKLLAERGDAREAIEIERRVVDAAVTLGDKMLEGGALTYLAEILLDEGEVEEAEHRSRRALDLVAWNPHRQARAAATLARSLLAQGRTAEARAVCDDNALAASGEAHAIVAVIALLRAESRHDAAASTARDGRQLLERRAATIDDPDLRRAYLGRVSIHRTLCAAADMERS